ncbi:MAG: leucine/isoleucine/valine transporter permease subunit [Anaerolineae bacterium]|nr:leucine/isoleucine/valine transporter permease subunit [Anaerolineae bacterium]
MQIRDVNTRFDLSPAIRTGLIGGIVTLLICLIGIVEVSTVRAVIYPILSLGQTLLLIAYLFFCSMAVRRMLAASQDTLPRWLVVASGGLVGLLISVFLAALVLVGHWINLRSVLVRASPQLYDLLTFGQELLPGIIILLLFGLILGALVGAIYLLPDRMRRAIILGLALIPLLAILGSAFFAQRGLSLIVAVIIFVVGAGATYLWAGVGGPVRQRIANLPPSGQRTYKISQIVLAALVVLLLPLTGSYPSQVLDFVGLYILMGLGLNIVVGFAGLLDLGYVAFFALGAYTMGVLTSPEIQWATMQLFGFQLSFWSALPFAVLIATLAGIILGVPVLGMRGDYLAIVTLGFGEIIRIVALSDWLKPLIGGSNGITRIPRPIIGPIDFNTPGSLYYLIVIGCLLAAFVAIRVKDSRLGRAWMALREDEDVAQAMGIDLVRTKLLAFATGAAFSGLSGAFFATMIGSIYPHSFTLMISINALSVIIVGGMGSIPGVLVGAVALVGLPEILREFSEYRLLLFGAALVFMMLTRPEGLIPEARRKLELHEAETEPLDESGEKQITVLA